MFLKDIATIRTGLVTARKKASIVDDNAFEYKLVTLKSFGRNGDLLVEYLDTFFSKEKVKEPYLTKGHLEKPYALTTSQA